MILNKLYSDNAALFIFITADIMIIIKIGSNRNINGYRIGIFNRKRGIC